MLRLSRTVYAHRSLARDASVLSLHIREITAARVHYGYRRVHVLLQRESWRDNAKWVYRPNRRMGSSLRLKRPRRNKSARACQPKVVAMRLNEIWSVDFVADALFDGRRLRAFTVVDNFSRVCLAIEVDVRVANG